MARKTKLIVYVDEKTLADPSPLFDAVFAYMIKRAIPVQKRKTFMHGFMKLSDGKEADTARLVYIDEWVQVRDARSFPFKDVNKERENDADKGATGGVPVDAGANEKPESGVTPKRSNK